VDVGNPIRNAGFVPNTNHNHDHNHDDHSLMSTGSGSKSANNMLSDTPGTGTVASVASSSFGMLSRMVSSSGNAPILPVSDPEPNPNPAPPTTANNHNNSHSHTVDNRAGPGPVYKKYVGPVLLCRGESMPLSAAKGDTKLFAGMIAAMNASWDKHCVFEEDKVHCRAGKPVIGLVKSNNSNVAGSWNVVADKNQRPESDLIHKLQSAPVNDVDVDVGPVSSQSYEFSGQALVPMRSLLKYLKYQEEKSDDDTNLKPDWIKTNRHMVDSIASGICSGVTVGANTNTNSNTNPNSNSAFYYKCNGYEMDANNVYHVHNDTKYREAVLDVVTCT